MSYPMLWNGNPEMLERSHDGVAPFVIVPIVFSFERRLMRYTLFTGLLYQMARRHLYGLHFTSLDSPLFHQPINTAYLNHERRAARTYVTCPTNSANSVRKSAALLEAGFVITDMSYLAHA